MKTIIVSIISSLFGLNLLAQTAAQDVTNGLADLGVQNLVYANQQFADALVLSPTNEAANALEAVTRLLLLPSTPAGSNFLNSLGFSKAGRDIYNWTSSLPVNVNGETLLPSNNTAVMVAFYRTNVMAALAASRANLAMITDPGFMLRLTAAETSSSSAVTMDYGDILLLQVLERAAEFAGYTANAQNCDIIFSRLQTLGDANELSIQKVLSLYPSLLTLSNPNDLASSKTTLTNAIALYFAASDFIRNVRSPNAQALFILSDDETNDEAVFRTELTNALASLDGPTTFNATNLVTIDAPNLVTIDETNPLTINASNYFAGRKTLRSLLPQFNGDAYVRDTLPDYTFGGILVNEPAYLTEEALRLGLYSYAGIYNGVGGVSYYYNGSFAVFVGTDQQATLVGYDGGDDTGDGTAVGMFARFSVDHRGNWSFQANNVSGFGSFGKSGDFKGELDYTNGVSVFLYASQQSPLGPFQASAGDYTGTFSSQKSGTLYMILAADGELFYAPVMAGNNVTGGGTPQLGSNDEFTYTEEPSGTLVQGTLNPATSVIIGTTSDNGFASTFKVTRTANVPFDVPPAIARNLPATLTARLGTNLTISLTATGSPPLCFQWYSNSVAIPSATANFLVISNLPFAAAGTYSVTVENIAGETNSAAVQLTVLPELIPPTNQITAPTPGSQVSNALYTAAGRARDKVAVSNVLVQINGGGWSSAFSTNDWTNWTAQVSLIPGSNTVQACAVNTSGNVSATNLVVFQYVVTAPLTVEMTGRGALKPNYNGALLRIGEAYSITASPAAGFGLTNWTGGTALPLALLTNGTAVRFVMVSNLMLQANFVETSRPTLVILAPKTGQHVTNALAYVSGTAADDWKVTGVWCQLTSNSWVLAVSTNGWTNWTTVFTLNSGTNTIRAYATDLGGNVSLTNTVTVVSSNTFKLRLGTAKAHPSPDKGVVFRLDISTGLSGHIQVSTNLINWTVLTNFTGANSTVNFSDPAANNGTRFYRAVIP